MENNTFNPLLDKDIGMIENETTRKIALCALEAARESLSRNEKKPSDFVSNRLNSQLTKIVKGKA